MFSISVMFDAIPAHSEEFAALSLKHAANSLTEEGCLQFEVYRSQDNPNRFYFHEVYKNRAAVDDVHAKAPYLAEFRNKTDPWIAAKSMEVWNSVE